MISYIINASNRQGIETVDIHGKFTQVDMDELVHVSLEGHMGELIVILDPNLYSKYTQIYNGKPVLYYASHKALYGTLQSVLLFWRKLSKQLKDWGFEINPYNVFIGSKSSMGNSVNYFGTFMTS